MFLVAERSEVRGWFDCKFFAGRRGNREIFD